MSRTMFEKAWNYVMKKREKALRCTICNIVLFDGINELDYFFYNKRNIFNVSKEELQLIYNMFWDRYPSNKESSLTRHHVNYSKNIQIPVCKSCHRKIHSGKFPELNKYLPVDKKPKNHGNFETNMYKPIS